MDVFANGFSIDLLLGLLKRRRWIVGILFTVILTAAVTVIYSLPNIYLAESLIIIEGQQIPSEFVRSTVIMKVERRLQEISQQILSRSRLEKLIEQFGLYEELKKDGASVETITSAMREDIGIQVTGKKGGLSDETVAFQISYTSPNPQKAADVANVLASYFIEENMKVRERIAMGTTEFLRQQLEVTGKRLEEQEKKVVEYKQKYMGELPEQRDANLRTMEVLQKQIESVSTELATLHDSRLSLEQQLLAESKRAAASVSTNAENEDKGALSLEDLKVRMAQMQVRFSDKHPDVIRTKQLIAMLEKTTERAPSVREEIATSDPVRIELNRVNAEMLRLSETLQRLRGDIGKYQQRVELAPRREQELVSLSRDYETTKSHYESLRKRLEEANLADDLEKNQKAERFRVLEPALLPTEPAAPERPLFFAMAFALSLAVAGGGALLREAMDSSFHRIEELRRFTQVPVLVAIPRIVSSSDRWWSATKQSIGLMTLALLLLVIVGLSYKLTNGNEELSRLLIKSGSGSHLRE
jgi:polysaccharide chain length determinant protein (PEP-CTERM system associated)